MNSESKAVKVESIEREIVSCLRSVKRLNKLLSVIVSDVSIDSSLLGCEDRFVEVGPSVLMKEMHHEHLHEKTREACQGDRGRSDYVQLEGLEVAAKAFDSKCRNF